MTPGVDQVGQPTKEHSIPRQGPAGVDIAAPRRSPREHALQAAAPVTPFLALQSCSRTALSIWRPCAPGRRKKPSNHGAACLLYGRRLSSRCWQSLK